MAGPTWVIDTANPDLGVPESAHCEACGEEWIRPELDRWADSLPATARAHNRKHHGPQLRLLTDAGDGTGELEPADVMGYYLHQGWTVTAGGKWKPPKP